VVAADEIRTLRLGTFVRPGSETPDGRPRVEVVLGYLVPYPGGLLIFDTGLGEAGAETDAHYRPRRRPLAAAVRDAGAHLDDVTLVVNCHLHFDHIGGNPQLAGRPVLAQRTEYEAAHTSDYTVPELVDHPGAAYTLLDGEAEPAPGLVVIPTPGHTAGHQSLAVRCDDGTVVLAGQSHDTASGFAADLVAVRALADGDADPTQGPVPSPPSWMHRILDLDPRRVLFAHDLASWRA
jgi:N-acyl homoserine lactone hydrolase